MNQEQVNQVLDKVFHGDYGTAQEARTDVNAALEAMQAEAAEAVKIVEKLKGYKASLHQQGDVYLQAMRAAHPSQGEG